MRLACLLFMLIGNWCTSAASANLEVVVSQAPQTRGINLGPIRLWPGRGSFSWRASVNRETACCGSKEVSMIPQKSNLGQSTSQWDKTAMKGLEKLWGLYPIWLARGSVTMGLLTAVPAKNGAVQLRDRLFGWNIITFGRCQTKMIRSDNKNLSDQYVCYLPILGGLMTTAKSKKFQRPSKHGLRKSPPKPPPHFGALSMRIQSDHTTNESTIYRMTTTIDAYKAALVGEGSPSSFRKWFYLSSQSLLHAYVMWRFHHFARSQVLD